MIVGRWWMIMIPFPNVWHGRKMKMNIYFVWLKCESGRKENTSEKSENDFSCLLRVILFLCWLAEGKTVPKCEWASIFSWCQQTYTIKIC